MAPLTGLVGLALLCSCTFNYVPEYSPDRQCVGHTSDGVVTIRCRILKASDGVFHIKSAELDAQYFANERAKQAGGAKALMKRSSFINLEGAPTCHMRPSLVSIAATAGVAFGNAYSNRGTSNCVSTGGNGVPIYTNCTHTLPPAPTPLPAVEYEEVCSGGGIVGYEVTTIYQIVGRTAEPGHQP
jgi:hypothetical protein